MYATNLRRKEGTTRRGSLTRALGLVLSPRSRVGLVAGAGREVLLGGGDGSPAAGRYGIMMGIQGQNTLRSNFESWPIMRDFQQLEWNDVLEDDCRQLIRLATREDLDRWHDWTTVALVPLDAQGSAAVVARRAGRICGLRAARLTLETMDYQAVWHAELDDGSSHGRCCRHPPWQRSKVAPARC